MDFEAIKKAAEGYKPAMVKFLRDMIAIPSESCEEEGVVKRIAEELKAAADYVCSSRRKEKKTTTASHIVKLGADASVKIIR